MFFNLIVFFLLFSSQAFADATNHFSGYTSASAIDAFQTVEVNGNVGVGTAAPTSALSIYRPSNPAAITLNSAALGIDSYTLLMLHLDNNVTDSEIIPKTVTNNGATFSNSIYKWDYSSYFNGTSFYLSVPSSTDFNFSGDFTVDFWMYPTNIPSVSVTSVIVGNMDYNAGTGGWGISFNGSNLAFYYGGSSVLTEASGMSNNNWYHVAIVRHGSTLAMYVNGTSLGTTTFNTSTSTTDNLIIGQNSTTLGHYFYAGYLDEIRISNGIARWTSNFTPPPSPYSPD